MNMEWNPSLFSSWVSVTSLVHLHRCCTEFSEGLDAMPRPGNGNRASHYPIHLLHAATVYCQVIYCEQVEWKVRWQDLVSQACWALGCYRNWSWSSPQVTEGTQIYCRYVKIGLAVRLVITSESMTHIHFTVCFFTTFHFLNFITIKTVKTGFIVSGGQYFT